MVDDEPCCMRASVNCLILKDPQGNGNTHANMTRTSIINFAESDSHMHTDAETKQSNISTLADLSAVSSLDLVLHAPH